MAKTCRELFANIDCTFIGDPDVEVTGIAYRSDKVEPGNAFCCIVGFTSDGHSYAQDAIERGAQVLVVERKVYLADATDVTEVVVSDSRKAMAAISAVFYDYPSRDMNVVGVTGTNGKTTTTYLVDHIARTLGERTGLIGTVGIDIAGEKIPSEHTTPEAPDLERIFERMREAHCNVVSMEVSSHALDLKRVWGVDFAVTAFTNLTQDHLDYHATFEAYFAAKAKLFSADYPAKRVINIDSDWGRQLQRSCSAQGDTIITTGFSPEALIHPLSVEYGHDQTTLELSVMGRTMVLTYPLVGRFNVENVMTAFGIGLALDWSAESIAGALARPILVPGRLERVACEFENAPAVYVDYAHTPDAVEKALSAVREITDGKVYVVFGCGGDRDSSKRSLMGSAALAADFAIVTSDNPRSEDPLAIIDDIVAGMSQDPDKFIVEPDRGTAIAKAVEMAKAGDAVLIAGKGHEDYQILAHETISFSDREVAAKELARVFS